MFFLLCKGTITEALTLQINLSGVDYKCLKLKVRFQTFYILVCFSKCLSRVDLSGRIMNLFGKME